MSPLPLYLLALFAVAVQSLPSPQEDGYVGLEAGLEQTTDPWQHTAAPPNTPPLPPPSPADTNTPRQLMGKNEPSQGASICTVFETAKAKPPIFETVERDQWTEYITLTRTLPGFPVDKTAAPRQRRGLAETSEITPSCSTTVTRPVDKTRYSVIHLPIVLRNTVIVIVTVRTCVAGERLVGKDCFPVKK